MCSDDLCPPAQHRAAVLERRGVTPQLATKVQFIFKCGLFGETAAAAAADMKPRKGSQRFVFQVTYQVFQNLYHLAQLNNFL